MVDYQKNYRKKQQINILLILNCCINFKSYIYIYMDVKFNSLFDNEILSIDSEHYTIDRTDTTLSLHKLILLFDEEKLDGIKRLGMRNFGDTYDYILDGRPCNSSLCSTGNYCESSGWPEVSPNRYNDVDMCSKQFMPQATRADPNKFYQNIDIEARLRNVDYKTNNCHRKDYKDSVCMNDGEQSPECSLACEKNIVEKDSTLPGILVDNEMVHNLKKNTNKNALQRAIDTSRKHCKKKQPYNSEHNFATFKPTKRRDVLNW